MDTDSAPSPVIDLFFPIFKQLSNNVYKQHNDEMRLFQMRHIISIILIAIRKKYSYKLIRFQEDSSFRGWDGRKGGGGAGGNGPL